MKKSFNEFKNAIENSIWPGFTLLLLLEMETILYIQSSLYGK